MTGSHAGGEEAANRDVITERAATTGRRLSEAKVVVDDEYQRLRAGGRIKDYVVLLAERRTSVS